MSAPLSNSKNEKATTASGFFKDFPAEQKLSELNHYSRYHLQSYFFEVHRILRPYLFTSNFKVFSRNAPVCYFHTFIDFFPKLYVGYVCLTYHNNLRLLLEPALTAIDHVMSSFRWFISRFFLKFFCTVFFRIFVKHGFYFGFEIDVESL